MEVRFASTFGTKRLRMMEMSQPLLDTVLKEGSVEVKGKSEDEAALLTQHGVGMRCGGKCGSGRRWVLTESRCFTPCSCGGQPGRKERP